MPILLSFISILCFHLEGSVETLKAAQNTLQLSVREIRELMPTLEMKARNGTYEIQDLKRHKDQVFLTYFIITVKIIHASFYIY